MTTEDIISEISDYVIEMIFLFDRNGDIIWFNKEAVLLLGYSEDELKNVIISDIIPEVFRFNKESLEAKVEFSKGVIKTVIYRKNHTCFPAMARIGISKTNEDYYYCTAIDASELDETKKDLGWVKEEVEQALKERNEFVANITHELRTPVSGILGHTRNALNDVKYNEIEHTLKIIERCCADMNKIIDNILDFSKLEAGKFVLEEREFDFNDFIEHIIDTHSARINEKGLKLVHSVDDNVPDTIISDSFHLSQVINNLLSNAVKFTSVGKITFQVIKTMQKGNDVELFFVVMDSGIGIAEEDKDKLFKSFSQVDASVTRRYGGTGLGLAVCKQVVSMMHGNINVQSEKGKGSMFTFSIHAKVPDTEVENGISDEFRNISAIKKSLMEEELHVGHSEVYRFGSPENIKELRTTLEKLILCVEMKSWEKAEMFADSMKQYINGGDDLFKRSALKLEMAVRKENYDKVIAAEKNITHLLEELGG